MGTVQTGNSDVFRAIRGQLSQNTKGLQLVLSIGNVLQPEHVGPVPTMRSLSTMHPNWSC